MAFMSQDHKAEIAAVVKPILKKYGVKGSLSVHNHTCLTLTVKSGKLDFAKDYKATDHYNGHAPIPFRGHEQVNQYHIDSSWSGKSAKFLHEVNKAMHGPRYFDKSDIQSDYFHCSHYIAINIGKWDKAYEMVK
jgi:hypothetical protein